MASNSFLTDDELARLVALAQQSGDAEDSIKRQTAMASMLRQGTGMENNFSIAGRQYASPIAAAANGFMAGLGMKKMQGVIDKQGEVTKARNAQLNLMLQGLIRKNQGPQTGRALDMSSPSATGSYDPYNEYREPQLG